MVDATEEGAATSLPRSNLAHPKGRDRLHLWNIAAGSADEVRVALRAAVSWGYLRERDVAEVLDRLDHLLAILWKLTR
jgi:four helix bundle protein